MYKSMASSLLLSFTFPLMVRMAYEPIVIVKVTMKIKVLMKANMLRRVSIVTYSTTKIVYIIALCKEKTTFILFMFKFC